ncbi:MAG: prepilin-type N-terminal cleavage/methylation domain-containing protein, partial [Myxococcota bacterium]|nr:prepilin-type N-terminal cleavage/methylation domain-containing protein [Myxococcota bacterium]
MHRTTTSLRRRVRRGFSMLELMVAVTLSSFVVAGLYGVFTMQTRQLLYQDLNMEMHQNLRFGVDMLSRSLRLAGFMTGGTVTGYYGGSGGHDDELPVLISRDSSGAGKQ